MKKSSNAPKIERRWLAVPTLARTITGPQNDELLSPGSLVATREGQLAIFDFGNMELRAFAPDGRQLWRTGRKGAGPGEFRNAMDVKVRANGEFVVLDMGNRRITTVSSAGRTTRTTPVKFSTSRFVPLVDPSQYGLSTEDSGSFWSAVNVRGDVVRKGALPSAIARNHSLAKEMFTTSFGGGSVVVFRWSDAIVILNGDGNIARVLNGIEPVSFPAIKSYPLKVGKFAGNISRIDPKATTGALSVAANDKQIFVLFGGASANRGRIIDVYDGTSGFYLGSRLLPVPVTELVSLPDGGFATVRSESVPAIDVWNVPSVDTPGAVAAATKTGASTRTDKPSPARPRP